MRMVGGKYPPPKTHTIKKKKPLPTTVFGVLTIVNIQNIVAADREKDRNS